MLRVPSTELQNNFGRYLKYAEAGEEIIVTKNGRDVARLVKAEASESRGAASPYRPKSEWVTYGEYRSLVEQSEHRYELIDGVLYNLASPSYAHQEAVSELLARLRQWFKGTSCVPLTAPFDVTLKKAEDNICVVQPDLLVICDRENIDADGKYHGVPALVVEVLAPSTAGKDLTKKTELYMTCGVKEYWIVDPGRRTVTVYAFAQGEIADYAVFRGNDTVRSAAFDGLSVPLGELFGE
ncbi:type II toxin-antitoxin system prevent-host-death family antitoxin [Thermobacillus sp. ZCTH02-B1]|uniref:type II toxin-antitoxin system prevent-host-death family antitoxin n=1 Tax=Thermobacillus sp. ZCTH02-B1 TaxID=1858795 RepID=UPI0025D1A0DB|nr:type II toxin-antitoxin system prevent-host-death family antitoxin [Thermobacillus sp. ZCTH02-B1]